MDTITTSAGYSAPGVCVIRSELAEIALEAGVILVFYTGQHCKLQHISCEAQAAALLSLATERAE